MNILCFDPGKYTGWTFWEAGVAKDCEIVRTLLDLRLLFAKYAKQVDVVVLEGFARGTSGTEDQIHAIEMCGAIKMMATYYGKDISVQYPANRKGYIAFAKELRVVRKVPTDVRRHVIDSAAHGLTFYGKKGYNWLELNSLPKNLMFTGLED